MKKIYFIALFAFVGFINIAISQPIITSFAPMSGPVGTSVTITGSNFNATPANNIVFFGATQAVVSAASISSLTLTVPVGATYQFISVIDISTNLIGYSPKPFLVTFPCGGAINTSSFAPQLTFSTGALSAPYGVAIGDLDGDGKSELALADYASGGAGTKVSVFLNTSTSGSVSFAPKVDFTVGSGVIDLKMGDINGDGKLDLATVNYGSGTISILKNTSSIGAISFATKVDFVTGTSPRSISLADFDGDGKLDMTVANSSASSISTFKNTGTIVTISFAAKVDLSCGFSPQCVSTGDVDDDGKIDIAVANYNSNTISLYRNISTVGTVTFSPNIDFATGANPRNVALGDLDGDGLLDLAVANNGANTLSLLRNTGTPGTISFAPKVDFATATGPFCVSINDIDGDGFPDVSLACTGSTVVSVLKNASTIGTFNFQPKDDFSAGPVPAYLVTGDLDGDGSPDLATADQTSAGAVSVLRNLGSFAPVSSPGTVITSGSFNANWSAFSGAVNYYLDVAYDAAFTSLLSSYTNLNVGNVISYNVSGLYPNITYYYRVRVTNACGLSSNSDVQTITTLAVPAPVIVSFTPTSGSIGTSVVITGTDFDPSIANNSVYFGAIKATVTSASTTSLTFTVPVAETYQPISVTNLSSLLTGYSTSSFNVTFPCAGAINSTSFAVKVDSITGANPKGVSLVDLDGDGKTDMVVSNYGTNTVSVYQNIGTAGTISYAPKVDFVTGTAPYASAFGDINADGKLDIAVVNYSANTVSVLKNTSTPGIISFAPKIDLLTGTNPADVAIRDINGDGKPEIVVVNQGSNTASVFKNTSNVITISFAAKVDFATGVAPVSVKLNDIDGDGKADIVTANYSFSTVSVIRNTSAGVAISFAAKIDFTTTGTTQCVGIADINGDGKMDIVATNYGANSISIFKSTSTVGTISFAAKVDFATGASPFHLAITDLDGDGKPDFAIANSGATTISVIKNTSTIATISCSAKVDFAAGTNPQGIAIGDIDGDGRPDLIVSENGVNKISFFRNTAYVGPTITSVVSSYSCGAGSVSLSATASVGTINWYANPVGGVSLGTGNSFNTPVINTTTLFYVDATNAGCTTLIRTAVSAVIKSSISSFSPILGNVGTTVTITGCGFDLSPLNNAVFFGATQAIVTSATSTSLSVVVPGGATYAYITVTNLTSNTTAYSDQQFIVTFPCSGDLTASSFGPKTTRLAGDHGFASAADLDGDGKNDMVLSYGGGSVGIIALRNTSIPGSISYAAAVPLSVSFIVPVETIITDFDMDGKPDIAMLNNNLISILRNTSTVGSISFASKIDFTVAAMNPHFTSGDLDGDGKPDIAVTNDNYTIPVYNGSILRNTSTIGMISFASPQFYSTGSAPWGVAIGDIDGDSKPELAFVNQVDYTVSVCKNTCTIGVISFAPRVNFNTGGSYPEGVYISDLDGDGKPDLTIANANSSSTHLSTLRNIGSIGIISFATKVDFQTRAGAGVLSIGDLNGDGKPDLAVANQNDSTISLLKNQSTIGLIDFATKVDYFTDFWPQNICIGDIDGDNRPDLAVSVPGSGSGSFVTFSNQISAGPIMTSMSSKASCSGSSVNIVFTSSVASTYSWVAGDNVNTTGESLIAQTTSTLNDTIVNSSGVAQTLTYTVTPTATVGGCVGTPQIVTITVYPLPATPTITLSGPTTFCSGNSVTLTSTLANSYLWSTGATTQSITVSTSENDSVTITDINGCSATSTITPVTVLPLPTAIITPSGSTSFCAGGSVMLDAGSGFATYLWSNGATTQNITVAVSENDSVTVTDFSGCSATSVATAVTVYALPSTPIITPSGPTTFCLGDSVILSSSIATSYLWSTGATTQNITVLSSQIDSVLITDINGCSSVSSSVNVIVNNDCYVWPGDANNDSVANNFDLLPIGLFYSQTGTPRASVSNTWQAYSASDWGTLETNGSDIKHADCNGDGVIDNNDTLAINLNFSLVHAFAPGIGNARLLVSDLYFVTASSTYNAGDIVDVEVWAGSSTLPVSNLYGVAFNINYDVSLVQPGTESLTYPTSWLGTPGTDAITIAKIDAFSSTAYGGITRIDHNNVSGFGKIADFKFQAKTSISTISIFNLAISDYIANNDIGTLQVFNTPQDSITIIPLATGLALTTNNSGFTIYPNPFTEQTTIAFNEVQKNSTIKIKDVLGKEIKTIVFSGKQLVIEKGEMLAGVYFVEVIDENKNVINKKIVLQ